MKNRFCRECGKELPKAERDGIALYFCSAVCLAGAALFGVKRGYAGKGYIDRAAVEKSIKKSLPAA